MRPTIVEANCNAEWALLPWNKQTNKQTKSFPLIENGGYLYIYLFIEEILHLNCFVKKKKRGFRCQKEVIQGPYLTGMYNVVDIEGDFTGGFFFLVSTQD